MRIRSRLRTARQDASATALATVHFPVAGGPPMLVIAAHAHLREMNPLLVSPGMHEYRLRSVAVFWVVQVRVLRS